MAKKQMSETALKKQRALAALWCSKTFGEAAEKVGIDRRTLYNYLHNDIEFARTYKEVRDRLAVGFMDNLTEYKQKAYDVIVGLLDDTSQPASIRLKAAQMILFSAAEQEKIVSSIATENITANKDMFDLSVR